jgi:hypothetical protein
MWLILFPLSRNFFLISYLPIPLISYNQFVGYQDMVLHIAIKHHLLEDQYHFVVHGHFGQNIILYLNQKLSTSNGYYSIPGSEPQDQLCWFSLCYLRGYRYVLFLVWRTVRFAIVISVPLMMCQASNARSLDWIFVLPFFYMCIRFSSWFPKYTV